MRNTLTYVIRHTLSSSRARAASVSAIAAPPPARAACCSAHCKHVRLKPANSHAAAADGNSLLDGDVAPVGWANTLPSWCEVEAVVEVKSGRRSGGGGDMWEEEGCRV